MASLGDSEFSAELALAVRDAAGQFFANRLGPLNRQGDEQGCRLIDGAVFTPSGFADAYRDG